MYFVSLKFSHKKAAASRLMQAHNDWLQKGFSDGVFLLSGTLQPKIGGGIIAHNTSLDELRQRVDSDPFVAQGVVAADIVEFTPSKVDKRLEFLLT
jgi:uncharacterized protein YciI